MGSLFFLGYPWGLILQVLALIHFFRRRPEAYWLFLIIFLGPLGSLIYIFIEVLPDLGLLRQSFDAFPRRKMIRLLEAAILDNPSVENYEELADLHLGQGMFERARTCYDKAIASRGVSMDAYYRRGIAEIELGDFAAAVSDLEHVTSDDPKNDRHRGGGLLAHAYANTGQFEKADALFEQTTEASTLSETYYNYAAFLASQGRSQGARKWAERILAKKPTMPNYLRRRERVWFRKAKGLIKRLPK
jgi:hypothetical protein